MVFDVVTPRRFAFQAAAGALPREPVPWAPRARPTRLGPCACSCCRLEGGDGRRPHGAEVSPGVDRVDVPEDPPPHVVTKLNLQYSLEQTEQDLMAYSIAI